MAVGQKYEEAIKTFIIILGQLMMFYFFLDGELFYPDSKRQIVS